MAQGQVAVVGSVNLDTILRVAELPRPGETVLASAATVCCGGKGANQALAAARAGGAATTFIGSIGADPAGGQVATLLTDPLLDLRLTASTGAPTGSAVVMVDSHGENSIVVASGVNITDAPLSKADRTAIRSADVLLCQLETPPARVLDAAAARREGALLVLNAAPAIDLPDELWACVDVLVVNQHEAEIYGTLLDRVPTVVITLGPRGSLLQRRDGTRLHVPSFDVTAVDTTGAGDTYCGVLAAELSRGTDLPTAMTTASAAAALTTTRPGSQPSIPSFPQVEELVAAAQTARLSGPR
ncbi:ribokinase [Dactylosporangium sp. NPDC005572]|uniref:ribokinase n=1 Tax=Dactylosporangium sp. NPDC005572 TaxID=3156889 RepID=UPI0033B58409